MKFEYIVVHEKFDIGHCRIINRNTNCPVI